MTGLDENEYAQRLVAGEPVPGESEVEFAEELNPSRVTSLRRPLHPISDYKASRAVRSLLRCWQPAIVHTHQGKAGWLGRQAAVKEGVPIIIHTYHGHTFSGYWTGLRQRLQVTMERRLARASTALIAQSPSQAAEIGQILGKDAVARLRVIEPGVDFERLDRLAGDSARMRRDLNVGDAFCLGFIGRLADVKNCRGFLDVLKRLQDRQRRKVVGLISGGGSVEQESDLMDYAAELGLTEQCRWLGFRSDVATIIDGAGAVLSPSISEGTPLNLIEALSRGTPIVATDVGGVKDTVGRYPLARIVAPNDPDEMTDAVIDVMQTASAPAMDDETAMDVRSRFSWKRMVGETAELYRELSRDLPGELS